MADSLSTARDLAGDAASGVPVEVRVQTDNSLTKIAKMENSRTLKTHITNLISDLKVVEDAVATVATVVAAVVEPEVAEETGKKHAPSKKMKSPQTRRSSSSTPIKWQSSNLCSNISAKILKC